MLAAVAPPSDPTLQAGLRLKQANLRSLEGQPALAWQANLEAVRDSARAGFLAGEWSARLNLVKAAAREGRSADARQQLAAAEALVPRLSRGGNSDFALHFHRALVLHAEGALEPALAEVRIGLENRPGDEWLWELQLERALIARDQKSAQIERQACHQVEQILFDTAHTGSPDASVHRWVNAHAAVTRALGGTRLCEPPNVTIGSPFDGYTANAGATITFTGSAYGLSEGGLPDSGLSWSDNGAALGGGSSVTASYPTPGDHTIQLIAQGCSAITGQATITIHIIAPPAANQSRLLSPSDGASFLAARR